MALALNDLIDRLAEPGRQRLLEQCESVPLVLGAVLDERGHTTAHAHFPVAGFISLVARTDPHPGLEVGMVGREGMLGLQLALGVPLTPLRALVQGSGTAWRVAAPAFARELVRNPGLRQLMGRYAYVRMAELATAAACQRFHLIGPRLARWLLMSQDRARRDCFHVTHEFLAYMLGVRRVGITTAAGDLQRSGLIRYHRGELTVLDRPGLLGAACSCYAADRHTHAAVMGAAPAAGGEWVFANAQ